eukprot:gene12600-3304_t
MTTVEFSSPLAEKYEFFLQNINALFSIIKHMTDIESPRKKIQEKLLDADYRMFSFTQIKTQVKACLCALQDLHLMADDSAVSPFTKKFANLFQNILTSWDTFYYSIAVVDKGPGKIDLSNNIRIFYMLTKFDMAEFAKNIERQRKRMELALFKSQTNLVDGSFEDTQLTRESFKLKNLKFEELLFKENNACYDNDEVDLETVEGFLDDSFEYVPKQASDPKYYHPKKPSSYVTYDVTYSKEQSVNDSFLEEQKRSHKVEDVYNVKYDDALNSMDDAIAEAPLKCTSRISLHSSFEDIDVFIESVSSPSLSNANISNRAPICSNNFFEKSYSADVTPNQGLKRKRNELLCDVTNRFNSFPCPNSVLPTAKNVSLFCHDGNIDCYQQTSKRVKLSSATHNFTLYEKAVENEPIERSRFKGMKDLGRRLKKMKSRIVKNFKDNRRNNTTTVEFSSPLAEKYEFFLQNINALFSIIKHMTDIESPRKKIQEKLLDADYRMFSFTQIKTQVKACLCALQDLHLMADDSAVSPFTKKFANLFQNILTSWDTFYYSIAVVDKGPGKIDLSNNIRIFYMLTKFDMEEFAKNIERQRKRMELALSKSQTNLVDGSLKDTQLTRESFKLKNLKFEELLFKENNACYDNDEVDLETVEGFLDDSFEYVPKQASDPKYYHPKKPSSSLSNANISNRAPIYSNNLFEKSYSADVTLNRGLKRKRHELLCDVTNRFNSFPCPNSVLHTANNVSLFCHDGNIDCYHQTLKRVKLSSATHNVTLYEKAVENEPIKRSRFKGMKDLGRRLKKMKSRIVKNFKHAKRSNTVFPTGKLLKKLR